MRSGDDTLTPAVRTITATTFSPHFGSGNPTTAHWRTAGCSASACSTSVEYTFSPPVTIISLTRSTMYSRPAESLNPASPLRYQPLTNTADVVSGCLQYPG